MKESKKGGDEYVFCEERETPLSGVRKKMRVGTTWNLADGEVHLNCFTKILPILGLGSDPSEHTVQQVRDAAQGLKVCPVCGGPQSPCPTYICNGYICRNCDLLMRGRYGKTTTMTDADDNSIMNYSTSTEDKLRAIPISAIKQMYEAEKASQKEYLDKYGNIYENIFAVNEGFDYDLGASGGIRNAVRLKDKLVVKGCIEKGQFAEGNPVFLIRNGEMKGTTVLAAVPCTGYELRDEIIAGIGMIKQKVTAHSYGWLVLDLELEEAAGGDVVVS